MNNTLETYRSSRMLQGALVCGWAWSVLIGAFAGDRVLAADGASQAWLRPFTWQESPEPGSHSVVAAPEVPPSWNIFKWSNEPGAAPQQQKATANVAGRPKPLMALPPASQGAAVAYASDIVVTDNAASLPSSVREAIEWPAADESRQQEQAQEKRVQSQGQGTNPFGWTNSGPPVRQSVRPAQEAPVLKRSQEPWHWTNERRAGARPKEILPPDEPSFSSAVYDALSWSDQPEGTAPTNAELGRPPEDASDEQLVEWEKRKYPWIRPFYWSNEQPELAQADEITPPDPANTPGYIPLMAKPFTWENRQASRVPNRLPNQVGTSRTYPTRQAAALLQPAEELPKPVDDIFQPQKTAAEETENQDQEQSGLDGEGKGTLAEAESLGEAPEDNSLQFLRADTVLLEPGKYQFDYGLMYTKFDIDVPVLFAVDPNTVGVSLANLRFRELRVPLEIRYGLARRVQLFLNVPFAWANSEFSFSESELFENDGGIGDVTFGGSFLLRENDPCNKPDMILTLAATAPTGKSPFRTAGTASTAPTLGSGNWSLASNVLWIKNYDPVVMFYGLGTRQHFDTDFNGQELRRGGEYNYQFGVGFGVNSKITFSTRFNGAYISETRLDGQRLLGTVQEPMTLSLAMTVAKNKKLIEPFVDFGLTDDASDARFGIVWTR